MSGPIPSGLADEALRRLLDSPGRFTHVSTADARRRALFVSDGVTSLVGDPVSEWLGAGTLFWDRLHPDDAPAVQASLAAAPADGPVELRYRLRTRDGRILYCSEIGARSSSTIHGPIQYGLVTDETESRLIGEAADAVSSAVPPREAALPFCDPLASLLGLDRAGFVDAGHRTGSVLRYDPFGRRVGAHATEAAPPEVLAASHEEVRVLDGPGLLTVAVTVQDKDGHPRGILWGSRARSLGVDARDRRILSAIARHASLALQRADLVLELERISAERQRLAESVVMAHEDERRRIANELHDSAGQTLMAAIIQLDLARLANDNPNARDAIGRARGQVEQTLEELRGLAHALRPAALDRLGLSEALREMASALTSATLTVQVDLPELAVQLEPEVATAIFRIAQASLANVARHARAQTARLSLVVMKKQVVLTIEDDGLGIRKGPSVTGIGLVAMRERAHAVGGTVEVEKRTGGGTCVRATLPV